MKLLVFGILSLPLTALSWRSLFGLKNHGLYRFVVWECILWLAIQNSRHLIVDQFDLQQVISSVLMIASLVYVLSAVFMLRKRGRAGTRRTDPTLLGFEQTTELVESGIFGHVRHPMYGSLLFLAWGVLLRNIEADLLLVAMLATGACMLAALMEEKENMDYFGERYTGYRRRTKMFIPFVI